MVDHARAHDRDLGDLGVLDDVFRADLLADFLRHLDGAVEIVFGHREADVVGGLTADGLGDHVDIHATLGERPEQAGGDARLIRHFEKGHLGLVEVRGHAAHRLHIFQFVHSLDQGAQAFAEGGADPQKQIELLGVLHRAGVQHLGAEAGELEHLVERDLGQQRGLRHDPRVGGEDAVDVGVDLAHVGFERGRQRHRGGVGAAPAQRADLAVVGHALEARHHRHEAVGQQLAQAFGLDVGDLGLGVQRLGADARLGARQGNRLVARVVDGHRHQGDRDLLAGGEQHVDLARGGLAGDLVHQVDQLVGGVAHGRHHHHHLVAVRAGPGDPLGHFLNPLGGGDGGPTELLDD
ncbi:hypothetical protein D3C72_596560 [compost metagenome]